MRTQSRGVSRKLGCVLMLGV
jgi:hypothetical protein